MNIRLTFVRAYATSLVMSKHIVLTAEPNNCFSTIVASYVHAIISCIRPFNKPYT